MKRLMALVMLVCFVFCGCDTTPVAPTGGETDPTQTQATTEATTDLTQAPTTTATQEPAPPEKVTVYLLEKTYLYDSGCTEYLYDENGNIDTYKVYTIENELMYTAYFEQKDANGMAQQFRADWGDGNGEIHALTWREDGKLKEEQYTSGFSGYQYEYDQKGNVTEKREYYDGILSSIVRYAYDGEMLLSVCSEDADGNKVYDCLVENGRIVEKNHYAADGSISYSYYYEYDENGNLTQEQMCYDGETFPSETYTYKTVETDTARAQYLIGQQTYLLSIT